MLIVKLEQQQDITGKDKYNILSLYNLERSTYQDDGRVLNKLHILQRFISSVAHEGFE